MSAVCVCVYTDYISVWVKVNERQAYAGGEQCVCLWNTSKLNLSLLIQLREFGQRHFTEHNSALQSHQNSARHTFRALKVPQRQTRWSKHFHLNNGCSNLNDLTGTSSLLTDAFLCYCLLQDFIELRGKIENKHRIWSANQSRHLQISWYQPFK